MILFLLETYQAAIFRALEQCNDGHMIWHPTIGRIDRFSRVIAAATNCRKF
jgi:hypothetical protein